MLRDANRCPIRDGRCQRVKQRGQEGRLFTAKSTCRENRSEVKQKSTVSSNRPNLSFHLYGKVIGLNFFISFSRALLMLEACKVQQYPFSEDQVRPLNFISL